MPTVLHVSPHPDDESIAAPCTLLALQEEAGWSVINAAVSLGRPADRCRRATELEAALAVPGFESVVWDMDISSDDDLRRAARGVGRRIQEMRARRTIDLVVGPHPREGHHGHAVVGRGIRQAVWSSRGALSWWMWSVWSELPKPTLVVDCPEKRLVMSEKMLAEHVGENERTDYQATHRPTRRINAVMGVEKTFGYGSTSPDAAREVEHAELLTEVTVRGREWMVGGPRVLDPRRPWDGLRWGPLKDWSILSSARLKPIYRPVLPRLDSFRSMRAVR